MTAKRVVFSLLAAEITIALAGGVINFVATDRGQTCEVAYADCGVSSFVNFAWAAALVMIPCIVATFAAACVYFVYKKIRSRSAQ